MHIFLFYASFVIICLTAFLLTLVLVPAAGRLARVIGAIDKPGFRKVHTNTTPRLGGMAFFVGFWVVLAICWVLATFVGWADRDNHQFIFGLGVGSFLLFLVGGYDDIRESGPYLKLFTQIIAAVCFIWITRIRILEFLPFEPVRQLLTVVWIVGLTNSFNLLDNMDGLSAGIAAICSLMMMIIGLQQGSVLLVLISVILLGVLLAFLKYNFYPASIFMGDSGSYFLGFTLAVMSIKYTYISEVHYNPLPVFTPLLVFAVPLFDTLSVIYIRKREKRPIFRGDMSHFSHRLVALGMTQKQAVLFIYLVSFIIGVSATFLPAVNVYQALVLMCQACAIFVIIIVLMRAARNVMAKSMRQDFDDYSEYY